MVESPQKMRSDQSVSLTSSAFQSGTLSLHLSRNPYNSTDRELIVSTLARASSNLNGLAIAQELERLNPRHTASSYQSYIRDNLHAGARLQLGIDKYRKDHHAQLQLESELRQRQREEDMVRGVPVDSKASVERRKRQAEEEVGEEESQPEGGWKR